MASLISGLVTIWQPDYVATSWQLLLIFYATCLLVFVICVFANNHLPMIDTICAGWTLLSIIIIFVTLSAEAKAGRNSAGYALGHFDNTLSGWGNFGFFIGVLPVAYTFSAIGAFHAWDWLQTKLSSAQNDPRNDIVHGRGGGRPGSTLAESHIAMCSCRWHCCKLALILCAFSFLSFKRIAVKNRDSFSSCLSVSPCRL